MLVVLHLYRKDLFAEPIKELLCAEVVGWRSLFPHRHDQFRFENEKIGILIEPRTKQNVVEELDQNQAVLVDWEVLKYSFMELWCDQGLHEMNCFSSHI